MEQSLSWAANSKYLCFNETGGCLPYSLTKAYREIEMQVHAFLIAAIVVCEWLISHSRVSHCGGRVNGIEINFLQILVMNTTDPDVISTRIHGRGHKLFYHTSVMYLLYSNIFGTQSVKSKLQQCVYLLVYFSTFQMYCLFRDVLCIVCVYMCTELQPPGGYPIAVNKNIISCHT